MADCFSLPNAAELVERLRAYATTCDNNIYGICMNAPNAMMQAADAIEALMQENAKLKAERDAAYDDIQHNCRTCAKEHGVFDALDRLHNGQCDEWEWRGVRDD